MARSKHPTTRGYVATADRAAAGEPTPASTVEQTAACEARRHDRCRGEVISLLAPAGQRCQCPCHGGDPAGVG